MLDSVGHLHDWDEWAEKKLLKKEDEEKEQEQEQCGPVVVNLDDDEPAQLVGAAAGSMPPPDTASAATKTSPNKPPAPLGVWSGLTRMSSSASLGSAASAAGDDRASNATEESPDQNAMVSEGGLLIHEDNSEGVLNQEKTPGIVCSPFSVNSGIMGKMCTSLSEPWHTSTQALLQMTNKEVNAPKFSSAWLSTRILVRPNKHRLSRVCSSLSQLSDCHPTHKCPSRTLATALVERRAKIPLSDPSCSRIEQS